jgi:glycosyltransferase involved in cell wall biosynthesis
MNKIPVDVIIPVYNGERYIAEALASVVAQTVLPSHIIVVNDGSTDKTGEIVEKFSSKVPIIHLKKKNGGLSSARNAGINRSKAKYLAFLDADDRWEPTKLEKQWAVFQKTKLPRLGVVYCDYYIIDDASEKLDAGRFQLIPTCKGDIYPALLNTNVVASSGSGVLVKRDCFVKAGTFDESLTSSEDWDMWLRIAESFQFDYVYEELVAIRRHAHNMQNNTKGMMLSDIRVLNRHAKALLNYPPRFRSPGNAAYPPLVLLLIKDLFNGRFIAKVWRTMSPDLRKHFLLQMPFIVIDMAIKAPPILVKQLQRKLAR